MRKLTIGILVMLLSLFITGCGCEKQTVNVTFDTDGGSVVEKQTIKKGEKIEEPETPTKEGYTFDGWYYNDEKFDFSKKVDSDITLEARWTKTVSSEIEFKNDFTLSKTKVTLTVGSSTTIKVTTDSEEKVIWKTSDKKIATVKDGKITAKSAGKATITVTIGDVSKTINVTVVKKKVTTTTTKVAETTTKKVETTTKETVKLSYEMVDLEDDTTGKATLYILKNGKRVAGSCDITTNSGKTVTKEIPANGYVTNKNIIDKITNIKVN